MRKQLVSGKKLLLFVDTGDNCRCPLAIGYLTKLLNQKNIDYIELKHMGVMTPNDLLPTPEVVQLLKEEGVDIRYHRSRPVNDDLIRQADLVLGFTAIHVQTCLRRVPDAKGKTFLLKDYVGLAHTGDQIHDPMGSTMEIFKKYFGEIKQSLQRLVEMEFITAPPEPKEVVILPTIIKPSFNQEPELPAYEAETAAEKAEKAAKKAKVKADAEVKAATKKATAAKAKAEKAEKAEKPSKTKVNKEVTPKKAAAKPAKAEAGATGKSTKKATVTEKAAAGKKAVSKKAEAKPSPKKETAGKPSKAPAKAGAKDTAGAKAAAKSKKSK